MSTKTINLFARCVLSDFCPLELGSLRDIMQIYSSQAFKIITLSLCMERMTNREIQFNCFYSHACILFDKHHVQKIIDLKELIQTAHRYTILGSTAADNVYINILVADIIIRHNCIRYCVGQIVRPMFVVIWHQERLVL